MTAVASLQELLTRAQEADPASRILLRDPIASHGEAAIEAMTDWLADLRLAAFAMRVLERIGAERSEHRAVLDVLLAVDRSELPEHLQGDLDRSLANLGVSTSQSGRRTRAGPRPAGRTTEAPGLEGRGYWVMRTSPGRRPFIWAEAERGRLRQGWGWSAEQNLDVIARRVRKGAELSEEEQIAWRSRRMRTGTPDGIKLGDLVVASNLPEWGQFSVLRVTGSYEYRMHEEFPEDRFGHILPVELVAAGIPRYAPEVSEALRVMLRVPTRLYSITPYGGDVERLIDNDRSGANER